MSLSASDLQIRISLDSSGAVTSLQGVSGALGSLDAAAAGAANGGLTRFTVNAGRNFTTMQEAVTAATQKMDAAIAANGSATQNWATKVTASQRVVKDGTIAWSATAAAVDGTTSSFGKLTTAMQGLSQALPGMTGGLGQASMGLGGITSVAAAVGPALLGIGAGVAVLGAFGAASVSAAASFEQWTQRLVNGAQESSANLEMIRQGVLQVSTDVGISIGKLSDATYFIESAGLHGADALKVLSVSAKAARIDMADVSTVAQALTTVMHIYGDSNELAAARAGQLIQIVGLGKTTLETFSAAFGNIGVTAATLHVPFEQLGAMIDIDTKYSLDAAMATTGLRFGLAALASETPKGTKALAELGLTSNQVAQQMLTQGPVPVLELIKQRMDELGVSEAEQIRIEKAIFGGTRGWQGLLAVINNLPEANEMIKTIGNTTQATDEFTVHWQSTLKETTTQAGRLKAELGQVATEAGGVLLPAVSFATEVIANGIAADIKQVHALGDAFIWLAKFTTGIDISGPPPAPAASGVQFGPPMPTDVRFGPPMPTADQIAAQAKVDAQNAYNKALADTKALTDSYAGQSLKHLQSQQQAITANLDQQRSAMAALRSQMDAAKTAGDDVNAKALSDQIVGLNGHMEDEQSKLEAVNSAMAQVRSTTVDTTGAVSAYGQAAAAAKSASDIYKEVLQQQQDAVNTAKDALSAYKTTVDAAKTAIEQLAQTNLKGTQSFSDQAEAVQEQINRVQLQTDRSTLSGGAAPAGLGRQLKQLQDRKKIIEDTQAVQLGPEQYRIQRAAQVATQPAEMTGPSILAGIAKQHAVITLNFPKEQQAKLTESIADGLLQYGKQLLADATKAAQSAVDAARAGGTKAPVSITMSPGMIRIENLVTSAASQADIEKFLNEVGIQGVGAIADALATGQRVPVGHKAAA